MFRKPLACKRQLAHTLGGTLSIAYLQRDGARELGPFPIPNLRKNAIPQDRNKLLSTLSLVLALSSICYAVCCDVALPVRYSN